MAIAYDTYTNPTYTTGTSQTISHTTTTASNRIMFVAYTGATGGADLVTGVTYNGVSLTKIYSIQCPGDRWTGLYYLVAPATGTNNVVISASSSSLIGGIVVTYSGVHQTVPLDFSGSQQRSSSTTNAMSLTTTIDGCWLVGASKNNYDLATAGANTTVRRNSSVAQTFCDSNGAKSPSGTYSLNLSVGGAANWGSIFTAIVPDTYAPASTWTPKIIIF